jgi:hypothetical protein
MHNAIKFHTSRKIFEIYFKDHIKDDILLIGKIIFKDDRVDHITLGFDSINANSLN